jgi:phosphatidylserine decarboxylase
MRWQTLYEARWIFAVLVVLAAGSFLLSPWLALIWGLLILYTFYFFRDPNRALPIDETAVVAAADGVVVEITEMEEPDVVKAPMRRIAIFLSVFDVHTNRAPVAGTVIYSERRVGKMLDARHPDASRLNECRTWGIASAAGTVVVRQITGAIARRIVAWAQVGQHVARGERFGMIRFGSRTEVYLPPTAEVIVRVGDRVQGGASVIARLAVAELHAAGPAIAPGAAIVQGRKS